MLLHCYAVIWIHDSNAICKSVNILVSEQYYVTEFIKKSSYSLQIHTDTNVKYLNRFRQKCAQSR